MSLTYDDLQAIRKVVEETVHPINGELEALGNDIKEAANQAGIILPSH